MGMKRSKNRKNISRKNKKSKKYIKKGGSNCSVNIPQTKAAVVNTGNCNIGKTDCFNKPEPLPQLGILPTSPNLSEVAFDGRYCCGVSKAGSQTGGSNNLKDGIINIKDIIKYNSNINFYVSNGRFSTEGLSKKDAQNVKNKLNKKNINAKITDYALGGFKLYFD